MSSKSPKFCFVVPCYNEQECLRETLDVLQKKIGEFIEKNLIHEESYALYVDDGSKDSTWEILSKEFHANIKKMKALKLSTNVGHQKALFAGLKNVSDQVDCCITIDADLQDDLRVVSTMIESYSDGYEVVLGVRRKRNSDTFFKKTTAKVFYLFMSLLGIKTVINHADFRLLGSKSLKALTQHNEKNIFLRGMVVGLGFKTKNIFYDRKKRTAGVTKYSFSKMISLAWEGVSSFSAFPMRILAIIGFVTTFISFAVIIWAFAAYFSGRVIPGWTSTVVPLYFLGGVQMFGLGLLGEYIGKIYVEVKARPHYFLDEKLWDH